MLQLTPGCVKTHPGSVRDFVTMEYNVFDINWIICDIAGDVENIAICSRWIRVLCTEISGSYRIGAETKKVTTLGDGRQTAVSSTCIKITNK